MVPRILSVNGMSLRAQPEDKDHFTAIIPKATCNNYPRLTYYLKFLGQLEIMANKNISDDCHKFKACISLQLKVRL